MKDVCTRLMTMIVISLLFMPVVMAPTSAAYSPGDEAAVFGHTFAEEYWTNDSLRVETATANASLTASYVGVDDFSAFLIAFNHINQSNGNQIIMPYQLFGMHYTTPEDQEVFIGAIFAFLLAFNDTFPVDNPNDLPDVGNESAWYCVPVAQNPWNINASVEPIPATRIAEGHYQFGMRYTNLSIRIVDANNPLGFLLSLVLPVLTVLISEFEVVYDIRIDESGQVSCETVYTIGQVTRARWLLHLTDTDPSEIIIDSMKISAVHYLSIFTSTYNVTSSGTGTTILPPTGTQPLNENISILVGNDNERAFDIGLGRQYALYNESTDPWDQVSSDETAVNCLLEANPSDFLLVAWQAPLSIFLFAHMAYSLSSSLQSTYSNVNQMVSNVGTAFDNTQMWYGVAFPEWNGLRIEQDPVYVAYTSLNSGSTTYDTTTTGTTPTGEGGVIFLIGILAVVVVIVILIKRR
ncbi:MAG: hypothetical protein ACTSUO_04635 [Candidatus Thorarchaeota archaeon]